MDVLARFAKPIRCAITVRYHSNKRSLSKLVRFAMASYMENLDNQLGCMSNQHFPSTAFLRKGAREKNARVALAADFLESSRS